MEPSIKQDKPDSQSSDRPREEQHFRSLKEGGLLGAEIIMGNILSIGVPGIFVARVVTPIVLVTTDIFGRKIVRVPSKTLNISICADRPVCGVFTAIATAAACRAKKEEVTLAVGLSLAICPTIHNISLM